MRAWLAEPTADPVQLRSLALLKLYFGQFAAPGDLAALAEAQRQTLEAMRAAVDGIVERLRQRADRRYRLTVAELIADLTAVMLDHWARLRADAGRSAVPEALAHSARAH